MSVRTFSTAFAEPMPVGAQALLGRKTITFVLAGGRGNRLGPLTDWRSKPSLPFAGKFRIVDFTLSNCVNSGMRRIGVCTQYRAQSLIRHLHRGWSFLDGRFGEFIELLPAQQRVSTDWYRGTADAVYQNLEMVRRFDPAYVLVLGGDHIYKMDYTRLIQDHVARGARATVGCIEVPVGRASGFGIVQLGVDGRIVGFLEKPASPPGLPGRPDVTLASMGIYAFDAAFLQEVLQRDARDPGSAHDFGKDILPRLVSDGEAVFAHDFAGSCVGHAGAQPYWRDVGTVDAYWEANLDLTHVVPDLDLYDGAWPIWTWQEHLPPAKFVFDENGRRGIACDSLVASGSIVSGSEVRRSLLFNNVRVHSYCVVEDSVVLPNVRIGRGAVVRRAVIDKECRLPEGFCVGVDEAEDRRRFHVTASGVAVVVPEMLGQRIHEPQQDRDMRADPPRRGTPSSAHERMLEW
jgi:glucose-1-phosphate adenylyltransferase